MHVQLRVAVPGQVVQEQAGDQAVTVAPLPRAGRMVPGPGVGGVPLEPADGFPRRVHQRVLELDRLRVCLAAQPERRGAFPGLLPGRLPGRGAVRHGPGAAAAALAGAPAGPQDTGPLLDLLYAQLRRCGDHACTGKPFTEHRNAPVLTIDPASGQPAWQQVANAIGDAIRSGMLPPGEPLPSVREMSALQDVPVATLQHALAVLADEGLLVIRQGRTAVVAGDAGPDRRPGRALRDRDHDCRRAGCKPHVCRPMTAKTIRNIHTILSGAFATAKRWEWIAWNPAESAKPPAITRRPLPATTPEDVAKVIAEGRKAHPVLALYLWLAAITGARRGELCALQVRDVDLVNGVLRIAFNYVVVGGLRVRKDTKTHQDRYLAIDPVTCAMISEHLDTIRAELAAVGLELPDDAYVFSNDPMSARPWKGLRHYADPISEVDRRAAAYLAQLTAGSAAKSD